MARPGKDADPRCPRCGLEHDRVSLAEWILLLRDVKPKPPGKQGLVLVMLAARLNVVTGCGWTTDPDLGSLAGCGDDVVERATRWGRDRLLVHRVTKGYRITGGRTEQSHWLLTNPATQPRARAAMGDGSQPRNHAAMAPEPTPHSRGANPAFTRQPTPRQRGSKGIPGEDRPGKPLSLSVLTVPVEDPPASGGERDDLPSQPQDQRGVVAGHQPGRTAGTAGDRVHVEGQDRAAAAGLDSTAVSAPLPPSPPPPARSPQAAEPAGFDDFWEVYPRKDGEAAARKAWTKAVAKAGPAEIIAGAERYRDDPDRAGEVIKYTKLAAGWLEDERWADEGEDDGGWSEHHGGDSNAWARQRDAANGHRRLPPRDAYKGSNITWS